MKMNRAEFVRLIDKVFPMGLSASNIKAGFEKCGIYPVDRSKYDYTHYEQTKLGSSNRWVQRGKPRNPDGTPDTPKEQLSTIII